MDPKFRSNLESSRGKELYGYQKTAIDLILESFNNNRDNYNLLFQLPTGGGKTVIFSELTKRYILSQRGKSTNSNS